jgi:hypothetical protein
VHSPIWEWDVVNGYTFHNGSWATIPANNTSWLAMSEVFTATSSTATDFTFELQFASSPAGTFYVDNGTFQAVTNLTWVGGQATNAWDFTTANWQDNFLSAPADFVSGANVFFTDSGNNALPLQLTGTLVPDTLSVQSSINWCWSW